MSEDINKQTSPDIDTDFESIVPWNGEHDTGYDARTKLDRNFAKIKNALLSINNKLDNYFSLLIDSNGVQYLHTKFSLATMGSMTTFTTSNVNVPSIFDGLPLDNVTIWKNPENGLIEVIGGTGGGSDFDATAMWAALSAATNEQINKSHLTDAFNGYATESWVEGKGYALQTSLDAVSAKLNDFLEGSDTDTIINKWKELEAFLSGMAETDNLAEILSNKADTTYVNSELSKYVTLATEQTIDGLKHFTNGLTIGATKHKIYEKDGNILIEGNVLVTGGITAYSEGSGSGGSGGGGIDVNVLWEILGGTGTQQINKTHLTNALSGYATESWVTSKNYAVKATTLGGYGITDAYTKTDSDNRFVNVTGDTITGDLTIQRLSISHSNEINSTDYVYLGYRDTINGVNVCFNNTPFTYGSSRYIVWHAGNDGHGSGLDADLLDGKHANSFITYDNLAVDNEDDAYASTFNSTAFYRVTNTSTGGADGYIQAFRWIGGNYITQIYYDVDPTYNVSIRYRNSNNAWTSWKQFAFLDSNVASATKLQTARTIWGQSFDGTRNVSGELSQCTRIYNAASNPIYLGNSNNSSWVYTQDIASSGGYDKWAININGSAWFKKVNIGYTYGAEGEHLLNVNGTAKANALMSNHIRIECDNNGVFGSRGSEINNYDAPLQLQYNTSNQLHLCMGGGNVGIGTTTPDQRLTVNGNTHITGNNVFDGYTIYQPDTRCLWLRNLDAWHSGIGYDSNSTECMAFGVKNTQTKFKFKVGFDWNTFANNTFSPMTNADLEIGAGYVSMSLGYSSQTLRFENCNEINCYQGMLYLNHRGSGGSLGSTSHIVMCVNGGNVGIGTSAPSAKLHVAGDILSTGGITCYSSDQRAKTVIEQINLSLKQIANAPTIRFKWNGWKIKYDGKVHVGGIAQYMQAVLPETVLEADGMLNLDYATTGYVFAVQTARYLLKTDTEVEKLKKRVKRLEKQLKQLGYEEANIMDD